MDPTFQCPEERVWHAYYCLERDEKGEPPKIRPLEKQHGIANNTINKLKSGEALVMRTNADRLQRVARALNTTTEWLMYGKGEAPRSAWTVPPWPYSTRANRPKASRGTASGDLYRAGAGAVSEKRPGNVTARDGGSKPLSRADTPPRARKKSNRT